MTEVFHSPSSSSPTSISTPTHNATLYVGDEEAYADELEREEEEIRVREKDRRDQLSLLALLLTLIRKRFRMACKTDRDNFSSGGGGVMEIGWPTDVQHVNHVTFDRFDGFLGLPVEFEPEVPRRAPSASATVFGVSTESMQLSYDPRGNSIPTILLLLQRHMYSQGGLQAEGIFRITAGNSQEEYVRDQLNRGVIPEGIDVHCLAGLIKAWFRELPRGVLDSLSQEQVMQCQSEEACDELVRLLPPTEAALLDWSINLMTDVVQEELRNKMNSRNIAMVFAPNMTQMVDPLTALMYAVQVMNFLKTLIEKTLRERGDCAVQHANTPHTKPFDGNGHLLGHENTPESYNEKRAAFVTEDTHSKRGPRSNEIGTTMDESYFSYSTSGEESDGSESCETPAKEHKAVAAVNAVEDLLQEKKASKPSQSNNSSKTGSKSRNNFNIQQPAKPTT
ncbi:rho GTPase-activating protein 5-like [Salvia splendens]|uniref:rho GTPase-activating protein 5-like n=1 Tax=Salvia splendens TaxID=180675 RepID=UPI001C275889|nr:rho GTPase-activating protein 5-like [Salvia splendens]